MERGDLFLDRQDKGFGRVSSQEEMKGVEEGSKVGTLRSGSVVHCESALQLHTRCQQGARRTE